MARIKNLAHQDQRQRPRQYGYGCNLNIHLLIATHGNSWNRQQIISITFFALLVGKRLPTRSAEYQFLLRENEKMRHFIGLAICLSLAALLGYMSFQNPSTLIMSDLRSEDILIGSLPNEYGREIASINLRFPDEFVTIDVSHHPEKIHSGQSFVMEASFRGQSREPYYQDGIQTDILATSSSRIDQFLTLTEASLEVASAIVKPSENQIIGEDLKVSWSILIERPREHIGFLKLKSDSISAEEIAGEIRFDLIEHRGFWGWAALIGIPLSGLVALATLIQFFWQWRARNPDTSNN